MAEITKITTPIVPKENLAPKLKPVTDQAFELTDPTKVHKGDNEGKAAERQSENFNLLRESLGRPALIPLLKNAGNLTEILNRIGMLVETGLSASDAANDAAVKELLDAVLLSPNELLPAVMEQDKATVLFKGEVFDIMRDILARFPENLRIKNAVVNLLKAFDLNVNAQNSYKNILYSSYGILDYMFSGDRSQFETYLNNLADMLFPAPQPEAAAQENPQAAQQAGNTAQAQETAGTAQTQETSGAPQPQRAGETPASSQTQSAQAEMDKTLANAVKGRQNGEQEVKSAQASQPPVSQKEAVGILKNNLLPLLGEIVVKYYQNAKIRDAVMVVVHNMVRVDQGSEESLEAAAQKLTKELGELANLPKDFAKQFVDLVKQSAAEARAMPNDVVEKLTGIIEKALLEPGANPAILRQSENMLISMLQNQNSLMDILHFILPLQTPMGQAFTEFYVDPETDESVGGRAQGKSHKVFISVDSEAHGKFELCFLATGSQVDFSMWCPETLVDSLKGLRRYLGDVMQSHGYTMQGFAIDRMREEHSVAEVFPRLLEKKVGMDVTI